MNKTFKNVWNSHRGCFVAVSEISNQKQRNAKSIAPLLVFLTLSVAGTFNLANAATYEITSIPSASGFVNNGNYFYYWKRQTENRPDTHTFLLNGNRNFTAETTFGNKDWTLGLGYGEVEFLLGPDYQSILGTNKTVTSASSSFTVSNKVNLTGCRYNDYSASTNLTLIHTRTGGSANTITSNVEFNDLSVTNSRIALIINDLINKKANYKNNASLHINNSLELSTGGSLYLVLSTIEENTPIYNGYSSTASLKVDGDITIGNNTHFCMIFTQSGDTNVSDLSLQAKNITIFGTPSSKFLYNFQDARKNRLEANVKSKIYIGDTFSIKTGGKIRLAKPLTVGGASKENAYVIGNRLNVWSDNALNGSAATINLTGSGIVSVKANQTFTSFNQQTGTSNFLVDLGSATFGGNSNLQHATISNGAKIINKGTLSLKTGEINFGPTGQAVQNYSNALLVLDDFDYVFSSVGTFEDKALKTLSLNAIVGEASETNYSERYYRYLNDAALTDYFIQHYDIQNGIVEIEDSGEIARYEKSYDANGNAFIIEVKNNTSNKISQIQFEDMLSKWAQATSVETTLNVTPVSSDLSSKDSSTKFSIGLVNDLYRYGSRTSTYVAGNSKAFRDVVFWDEILDATDASNTNKTIYMGGSASFRTINHNTGFKAIKGAEKIIIGLNGDNRELVLIGEDGDSSSENFKLVQDVSNSIIEINNGSKLTLGTQALGNTQGDLDRVLLLKGSSLNIVSGKYNTQTITGDGDINVEAGATYSVGSINQTGGATTIKGEITFNENSTLTNVTIDSRVGDLPAKIINNASLTINEKVNFIDSGENKSTFEQGEGAVFNTTSSENFFSDLGRYVSEVINTVSLDATSRENAQERTSGVLGEWVGGEIDVNQASHFNLQGKSQVNITAEGYSLDNPEGLSKDQAALLKKLFENSSLFNGTTGGDATINFTNASGGKINNHVFDLQTVNTLLSDDKDLAIQDLRKDELVLFFDRDLQLDKVTSVGDAAGNLNHSTGFRSINFNNSGTKTLYINAGKQLALVGSDSDKTFFLSNGNLVVYEGGELIIGSDALAKHYGKITSDTNNSFVQLVEGARLQVKNGEYSAKQILGDGQVDIASNGKLSVDTLNANETNLDGDLETNSATDIENLTIKNSGSFKGHTKTEISKLETSGGSVYTDGQTTINKMILGGDYTVAGNSTVIESSTINTQGQLTNESSNLQLNGKIQFSDSQGRIVQEKNGTKLSTDTIENFFSALGEYSNEELHVVSIDAENSDNIEEKTAGFFGSWHGSEFSDEVINGNFELSAGEINIKINGLGIAADQFSVLKKAFENKYKGATLTATGNYLVGGKENNNVFNIDTVNRFFEETNANSENNLQGQNLVFVDRELLVASASLPDNTNKLTVGTSANSSLGKSSTFIGTGFQGLKFSDSAVDPTVDIQRGELALVGKEEGHDYDMSGGATRIDVSRYGTLTLGSASEDLKDYSGKLSAVYLKHANANMIVKGGSYTVDQVFGSGLIDVQSSAVVGTIQKDPSASSTSTSSSLNLSGSLTLLGDSQINTLTAIEGSVLNNSGNLTVNKVVADKSEYKQTNGSITSSNGWFSDSQITVEGGSIDLTKFNGGKGESLGNNNYVIGKKNEGSNPEIEIPIPSTSINSGWIGAGWKTGLTSVTATELSSETEVNLLDGGLLSVKEINFDGTANTLSFNGGTLETSLDQIFNDVSKTALDINATQPGSIDITSSILAATGVGRVKGEVIDGINFTKGTIVFNDEYFTASIVGSTQQVIKQDLNIKRTGNLTVAFTGVMDGYFTTKMAQAFEDEQEEISDVSNNFGLILNNIDLYNTDKDGSEVKSQEDIDGLTDRNLFIGSTGRADDQNSYINLSYGLGFRTLEKTNQLTIARAKEFALTGSMSESSSNPYEKDNYASALFTTDKALIKNNNNDGGTVTASGTFTLGSDATTYSTAGWVGEVVVSNTGTLQTKNGEFEVHNLTNNGLVQVNKGSQLFVDSAEGKGSWDNQGKIWFGNDAADSSELDISGQFENKENALLNAVNTDSTNISGEITNKGVARYNELEVERGGLVNNQGTDEAVKMTINKGAEYSIDSLASTKVSDLTIANGATLTNKGTLSVAPQMRLTARRNLIETADGTRNLEVNGEINNEGTINAGKATITVGSTGSISGEGNLKANDAEITISEGGSITTGNSFEANRSTLEIFGELTSAGTIEAKEADISVIGSGSLSANTLNADKGTIKLDQGALLESETLNAANGELDIQGELTIGGSIEANGSSLTVGEQGSVKSKNLNIEGGTLNIAGELSNTETLNADNSSISVGSGATLGAKVLNAENSTLEINGELNSTQKINADGSSLTIGENSSVGSMNLNIKGGTLNVAGELSNTETLNADNSSISVDSGATLEAKVLKATNSTLEINGDLDSSQEISADGSTLTVGTDAHVNAKDLSVKDGNLDVQGNLTSTGTLNAKNTPVNVSGANGFIDNRGDATYSNLNIEDGATVQTIGSDSGEMLTVTGGTYRVGTENIEAESATWTKGLSAEGSGELWGVIENNSNTLNTPSITLGDKGKFNNLDGEVILDTFDAADNSVTDNKGTIRVGQKAQLTGQFTNSGEADFNKATLTGEIINSGLINFDDADLKGTISNSGNGASVNARKAAISGEINNVNGSINIGSATIENSAQINNNGNISIESGTISGTVNNNELNRSENKPKGTLKLGSSSGSIVINPSSEITNNGDLTWTNNVFNHGNITGTGSLTLEGKDKGLGTYTNFGNLQVGHLTANNVTFTQESGSFEIANGWFDNSTINLKSGEIIASNIVDGEGNQLGLGHNTINIGQPGSSKIALDIDSMDSVSTKEEILEAYKQNSLIPKVVVNTLTSDTIVNIYQNGYLDVEHLNLDPNKRTLTVQGGAIQTSMREIFSANLREGIPMDTEKQGETIEVPANTLSAFTIGEVKNEIKKAIKIDNGIFVFDDQVFDVGDGSSSDHLEPAAVVSAFNSIKDAYPNAKELSIAFMGEVSGPFTVDTALNLQKEGYEGVLQGNDALDKILKAGVVFNTTQLVNTKEKPQDSNALETFSEENDLKELVVGDSEDENANAYQASLGFLNVAKADKVTLTGKQEIQTAANSDTEAGSTGLELALVGYIDKGENFHSEKNKLLQDSTDGGSIDVQKGVFTFGSHGSIAPTAGWIKEVNVSKEGSVQAKNGTFGADQISNENDVFVHYNAVLNSELYDGSDSSSLTIDPNGAYILGEGSSEGKIVNSGTLYVEKTLEVKGESINHGRATYGKLSVGPNALSPQSDDIMLLEDAQYDSTHTNTGVDGSSTDELELKAGGHYINDKHGSSTWAKVDVAKNATITNQSSGNISKGEGFFRTKELDLKGDITTTSGLFAAENASLRSGSLTVGGKDDKAEAILANVSQPVGAAIRVLSSGDLGFGANAISEADLKGAIAPSHTVSRVSISNPITLNTQGSMYVGTSGESSPATGLYFDHNSALVVHLANMKTGAPGNENAAISYSSDGTETSKPKLIVADDAKLYINLSSDEGGHVRKGVYYITHGFDTTDNESAGQWNGGWEGENLVAIPTESVARWKLLFQHDNFNTWIEAKLTEIPDVAAIEVAKEIIENDDKDWGPGGEFVNDVLNDDTDDLEKAKNIYNSMVNLAFVGGQLATAYSSMNSAINSIEGRTSMKAEGFNSRGWIANRTREGDLWAEPIGRRERVDNYDASKMTGVGYKATTYGIIAGADHLFNDENIVAGFAFSYQDGNAKSRGNASYTKNDFKTYGVQAYGNWSPNPLLNVVADVGYFRNRADITQSIPNVPGFNKAETKTRTNMFTVGVRAETTLKAEELSFIPHAGVRLNYTKTGSYDTMLDGRTAFHDDPHSTSTVQFPIGVALRGDIKTRSGWKIRPTADASLVLQAGDTDQKITFSTLDRSVSSTIYGRFTGAAAFLGSLGLQVEKRDITFGLRYGIMAGSHGQIEHSLKLEGVIRF